MTKDQKNEVIEILKGKFSQYNNFYITDTESLSVEQISNLRRSCFNKEVEMKVAKNTLIRKALDHLVESEKIAKIKVEPGTEVPSSAKRFSDIFVRIEDLADSIHSDQTGAFPYTLPRYSVAIIN